MIIVNVARCFSDLEFCGCELKSHQITIVHYHYYLNYCNSSRIFYEIIVETKEGEVRLLTLLKLVTELNVMKRT